MRLARRCDQVVVLCDHVGRNELPANVRIRTFGARVACRPGYRVRARCSPTRPSSRPGRPAAVLVHMIPTFLILAAPIAKPLRIPLGLWYTHWHADRSLRLATRLADVLLSVDRRSFPLQSPKVRGIGHAIDMRRFPPPAGPKRPRRAVAASRPRPHDGVEGVHNHAGSAPPRRTPSDSMRRWRSAAPR